eukprot:Sspe_Gene.15047::Locus_5215_Transcript_1_1_Confidence_1.000_Length_2934::g.15047::m.15047
MRTKVEPIPCATRVVVQGEELVGPRRVAIREVPAADGRGEPRVALLHVRDEPRRLPGRRPQWGQPTAQLIPCLAVRHTRAPRIRVAGFLGFREGHVEWAPRRTSVGTCRDVRVVVLRRPLAGRLVGGLGPNLPRTPAALMQDAKPMVLQDVVRRGHGYASHSNAPLPQPHRAVAVEGEVEGGLSGVGREPNHHLDGHRRGAHFKGVPLHRQDLAVPLVAPACLVRRAGGKEGAGVNKLCSPQRGGGDVRDERRGTQGGHLSQPSELVVIAYMELEDDTIVLQNHDIVIIRHSYLQQQHHDQHPRTGQQPHPTRPCLCFPAVNEVQRL